MRVDISTRAEYAGQPAKAGSGCVVEGFEAIGVQMERGVLVIERQAGS